MPMMGGPGRIGMMGMMGMADHVEGRIAFLRAELKITEAQMPQWNAFADALHANATAMKGMPAPMMQGGMMGQDGSSTSAPDRLDRMEKVMSVMLEMVKTTRAALAPLYAVLTEQQKKAADQLIHGLLVSEAGTLPSKRPMAEERQDPPARPIRSGGAFLPLFLRRFGGQSRSSHSSWGL
jgi:LTXXQ motif family protein